MHNQTPVVELLKLLIQEFQQEVEVSQGNMFSQKHLVKIIDLYTNSKMENAPDEDAVFFNIINQNLNVADRKSDIDFRNIRLFYPDRALQYILTAANNEFADDHKMSEFLKDLVVSYNMYGTAVVKAVKRGVKNNILKVVPFASIINDQNDFDLGPMIEHNIVQLQFIKEQKVYDQKVVEELEAEIRRKNVKFNPQNQKIALYEMHGYLPESYIDSEREGLEQQVHIIAEYNGHYYILFSGVEAKSPYMIAIRKKVHNRAMGMGVGEETLQAQMVTNESANLQIEQLRATAKIVYQSSDRELDGLALAEIDNRSVISHEEGGSITQVSTNPTSFVALQSYMRTWQQQSKDQNSANDIALGRGLKSGTPFATVELLDQEGSGTYDYYRERLELFIRDLYKEDIISMLFDYFNTGKKITDLLTGTDAISFYYFAAMQKANEVIWEDMVSQIKGPIDQPLQMPKDKKQEAIKIYNQIKGTGIKLTIDKDIDEEEIIDRTRIIVTSESDFVRQQLETLNSAFQVASRNPELNPEINAGVIMDQILALTDPSALGKLKRASVIASMPGDNRIQETQKPLEAQTPVTPQGINAELQLPVEG